MSSVDVKGHPFLKHLKNRKHSGVVTNFFLQTTRDLARRADRNITPDAVYRRVMNTREKWAKQDKERWGLEQIMRDHKDDCLHYCSIIIEMEPAWKGRSSTISHLTPDSSN